MVNKPKKPNKTNSNTINSILPDNKPQPKSRQQIYSENYQKNKEKKKAQQKETYTTSELLASLEEKIKDLEKTISQKNMPKEDKEKLLVEVEKLKKVLKNKKPTN